MDKIFLKDNDDEWSYGVGRAWNPWLMIQNGWEFVDYYSLMVGEGWVMTHGLVDDD